MRAHSAVSDSPASAPMSAVRLDVPDMHAMFAVRLDVLDPPPPLELRHLQPISSL